MSSEAWDFAREGSHIRTRRSPSADDAAAPDGSVALPPVDAVARSRDSRRSGTAPHDALARFRRLSFTIAAADAASIVAALLVLRLLIAGPPRIESDTWLVLAVAPFEWIAVFHAFGLYRIERLSAWDEFRGVIAATAVGVGLIMVTTVWWTTSIPRSWLAWTWLFAITFEMVTRRLFRLRIRRLKRDGMLTMRTVLVGANDEASKLADVLMPPARGFAPVGYVTPHEVHRLDGLPRLGAFEDLENVIRDGRIECVFVASSSVSAADLVTISRACRQTNVEMRVSANLPDILTSRVSIQPIDEVMALYLRPVRLTGTQVVMKRGFDLVVGLVGSLIALPLMGVIALAIRLTSAGPVIFRQRRMTKDGRVFTMLKFRTMVADAEGASAKLVDLTEPFFKLRDDPRLTRVGPVLRRFSLDELPQLWNVLRGEMSLVGPRPLRVEQIEADPAILQPRHEVKAGMTGWWQVNGRSDVPFEDAVRMDLFYIDNWSLTLDLYILLKTLGAILFRRGAY